jgi:hypothetical protein
LLVATARGMEPVDRQRFAAAFVAKHEASRLLGDGLVHAFSPTRANVRMSPGSEALRIDGWAPYCVSNLSHKELPGAPCPLGNVTCIACMVGLFR